MTERVQRIVVQHPPKPSTPEHLAYRAKIKATIEAVSEWIADHGPVTDSELNDWVLSQVTPMLTDGISISASEDSNGWWSYSFQYPEFVQPSTPSPE